ncbi:hypothetical protein QR680_012264 [Steinernema hermaphroditum]|uniref:Uncharacterized protein n=1 Tax=Steinernema hermaphroditum TaxID=289476 RepID=A0AA39LZJ8_9BILA|nr:hypothetical protein QR680_012264 [Steinernema hermaphroditum]
MMNSNFYTFELLIANDDFLTKTEFRSEPMVIEHRTTVYDLTRFAPHYADFLVKLDKGTELYVSKACKTAIRRIETQLMSPENDDLKALFKGADRYQLVQLTREILSTLTKEEIKALSLENSFKDPYSPETMAEIIDRFVEL